MSFDQSHAFRNSRGIEPGSHDGAVILQVQSDVDTKLPLFESQHLLRRFRQSRNQVVERRSRCREHEPVGSDMRQFAPGHRVTGFGRCIRIGDVVRIRRDHAGPGIVLVPFVVPPEPASQAAVRSEQPPFPG